MGATLHARLEWMQLASLRVAYELCTDGRDWTRAEERGCNECHNCFVKRLDDELEAARAGFYIGNVQRAAGTECTNYWQHLSDIWFQPLQHKYSLKSTFKSAAALHRRPVSLIGPHLIREASK